MAQAADRGMSSFDVARMRVDLSEMIGARAQKAYQPHYEQVVVRIKNTGASPVDLVIVRGKRAYLSSRERPMPQNPSSFAMTLRKHIGNARLASVTQEGFDRVLYLKFEHGRGSVTLVIEMFRDGNVILVDDDGQIIQPLTSASYRSRTLKRGEEYFPPPSSMDPREIGASGFFAMFGESDQDLERTLAGRANLGRSYASLVCKMCGLDPRSRIDDLDEAAREAVSETIRGLIEKADHPGSAYVSGNPQDPSDSSFSPFDNGPDYEGDQVTLPSLSDAIDLIFGEHDANALARRMIEKVEQESGGGEEDRLTRRAAQQRSGIEAFSTEASDLQKIGSEMLASWAHLEEIRKKIESRVTNIGWSETIDEAHNAEWIEEIDPANKTAIVYMRDENGAPGTGVLIDVEGTIHQSAQKYFDKSRSLKLKARGAEKALEETEKRQKKINIKAEKDKSKGRVIGKKRTRRYWFERHRWGIVGQGRMIIGGRDSKGNDLVVKKYLSNGDLYFHADLHGAPSCSLKRLDGLVIDDSGVVSEEGVARLLLVQSIDGAPDDLQSLEDSEKEEAATMAASWSRAWGAGSAAATAFHVRPSQVSKSTESGESLGRGSFVVRGSRGWHRDLTLRLAIGLGTVNGVPLPIPGSPQAISALCERWVEVRPGNVKKEKAASMISKSTGLNHDDVLSALPPGNCELIDNGLLNWN